MGWTGVANTGIALTCFALLFEAVGFSIPLWFAQIYKEAATGDEELGLYVSVWYTMSCTVGDTGSCKSETIKPNFTYVDLSNAQLPRTNPSDLSKAAATLYGWSRHWQVIQIITTVGVGFCLVAALAMVGARCVGSHTQCTFIFSIIWLLISGVIAIGVSCYTAYANAKVFDFLDADYLMGNTFPYSLLIYGIGGIISLIAVLALVVVSCNWDRYGAYREDDKGSDFDHGEPMSRMSSSRDRGHDNPRYGYDQPRRDYSERDRHRYDDRYADKGRHDDHYRYGYDMSSSRANRDNDYGRSNNAYGQSRRDDNYYGQSRRDDMYRPYNQYQY